MDFIVLFSHVGWPSLIAEYDDSLSGITQWAKAQQNVEHQTTVKQTSIKRSLSIKWSLIKSSEIAPHIYCKLTFFFFFKQAPLLSGRGRRLVFPTGEFSVLHGHLVLWSGRTLLFQSFALNKLSDSLHEIKLRGPKLQTTITHGFFSFHVECDGKTFNDVVYNKDLPNEQHYKIPIARRELPWTCSY